MNKNVFDAVYKKTELRSIMEDEDTSDIKDFPARRQAYNNLLDFMQRDGGITTKQAKTWVIPAKWDRPKTKETN